MTDRTTTHSPFRLFSRVVALLMLPLYLFSVTVIIWSGFLLGNGPRLEDLIFYLGIGVFVAVGALMLANRPDNLVCWIIAAIGLMGVVFPAATGYADHVFAAFGRLDPLAVFGSWASEIFWMPMLALVLVYLPLLFPDGRLLSRRWLWPVAICGLAVAGFAIVTALRETLSGIAIAYNIPNPIGIAGMPPAEESAIFPLIMVGFAIGVLSGAAAILVRFRRSKGIERQQLKWFLFAVALFPVFLALIPFLSGVAAFMLGAILVALPTAVGVSILRYRLYDIDVIIRKTLIYGVLTGVLALIYFGMVVGLQALIGSLTGEESPVVIVVSTLVIAALFTPLRGRVQTVIDRRFFRQKYNKEQVLARFGRTARDETDLDKLTAEMVRIVEETMQPAQANVWLKSDLQWGRSRTGKTP